MDESSLYIVFSIIFIWLIGITICVVLIKSNVTFLDMLRNLWTIILGKEKDKYNDKEVVDKIMKTAGYDYDVDQDIFYSREDAWQKSYGYCRLYDEAASSFSLIMDSEPIYFKYNNKRWLIEFWKGQYGMCTGGEVGVYQAKLGENKFSDTFNSTFYHAVDSKTNIKIKFSFYKNGKELFLREGGYWWITGFILGEYSEPEELMMDIEITFENEEMTEAFLNGLRSAGYFDQEFEVDNTTVKINFDKPRTNQPHARIEQMDNIQQIKNKILCDHYSYIIDHDLNSFDNLVMLKEIESDMFYKIIDLSKNHKLVDIYEGARKYIE